LILPIQRIPRYNLLLNELIKHTWQDHRDYEKLVQAGEKMREVAVYVNEKKREFENISKVREIQNSFVGKAENLVDPTRKFVRSDVVAVWTGTNDSDKKQRELILNMFNDLIVISSQSVKNGSLKFKEAIKIARVHIKEHKLRKWTIKKNDSSGGLMPVRKYSSSTSGTGTGGMSTPDRRGSNADKLGSLERRNSIHTWSVKNTLELCNATEETMLKVVFDNPLVYAAWIEEFSKLKNELDANEHHQKALEEKVLQKAHHKTEETKEKLEDSLSKSLEERKANWRKSLQNRRNSGDLPSGAQSKEGSLREGSLSQSFLDKLKEATNE